MIGNFGFHRELPGQHGYAIGSLIRKSVLDLRDLENEKSKLREELDALYLQRQREINSTCFSLMGDHLRGIQLEDFDDNIRSIFRKLEIIRQKIKEIKQGDIFMLASEEALPLEDKMRIQESEPRASELYDEFTFEKSQDNEKELDRLVAFVFNQNIPISCLPVGSMDTLISEIKSVANVACKIFCVISVIRLPRTRILDPVIIRKNARLSDNLLRNCSDYCVLTGEVLGGIFFAFEKSIPGVESSNGASCPYRLSRVSVVSAGAIPTTHCDDLKQMYRNWKDALLKNSCSGLPLHFIYRNLADVLEENGIAHGSDLQKKRRGFCELKLQSPSLATQLEVSRDSGRSNGAIRLAEAPRDVRNDNNAHQTSVASRENCAAESTTSTITCTQVDEGEENQLIFELLTLSQRYIRNNKKYLDGFGMGNIQRHYEEIAAQIRILKDSAQRDNSQVEELIEQIINLEEYSPETMVNSDKGAAFEEICKVYASLRNIFLKALL